MTTSVLSQRGFEAFRARVQNQHQKLLATEAEANPDMAFLASELMQCTLPHSNPGKTRVWKRTNNLITFKIESGTDSKTDEPLGIPYGVIPRLLLYFINTEAVRTRSRKIVFGRNLAVFMRRIGLDPNSHGKRSDYKRMIQQANRLFCARITLVDERQERELPPRMDMLVTAKQDLWWTPHTAEHPTLWESWLELTESFYDAMTNSPVPVDMNALKMLKRSPLALDLYGWATYRVYIVNKRKEPVVIPLAALQRQFGAAYQMRQTGPDGVEGCVPNHKEFNRKFRAAMAKVRRVYPALNYRIEDGAIALWPSRTAIASSHADVADPDR